MVYKLFVRGGIILALVFAFSAGNVLHPSAAHAAGSPHYSISHYVNFSDFNTTASMLNDWSKTDAARIDPPGDNASCTNHYYGRSVVVILDFGSLNESGGLYGASNWVNGFYLFAYPSDSINLLAYDYAQDYFFNSGVCSHVTVAIGVSNNGECFSVGRTANCIYNAGYYLAESVDEAEQAIKNYGADLPNQMDTAGGDDIENDGTDQWDTYNQTFNAVKGFYGYPTHYLMFDYGYNQPCGDYNPSNNNCGTGNTYPNTDIPVWDYGEIYNVAWGYGLDVPLPESYNPQWGATWGDIYNHTKNNCADCIYAGAMDFWGVMNDDGWNDPSNQYGAFWSYAGNPPQTTYDYDTCMHDLGSTYPCY